MTRVTCFTVLACLMLVCSLGSALTLDFEGLADSTAVTNQYAALGVTFSGPTVLTAGISLNESEFPPHSGLNVVFDDGGPIAGVFSTPVTGFGGFFTYVSELTMTAYDAGNNVVVSAVSLFSDNTVSSGNPPNESMDISFGGGIWGFRISGENLGSSFVMDDFHFTPMQEAQVPDAPSLVLGMMGLSAVIGTNRAFRFRKK